MQSTHSELCDRLRQHLHVLSRERDPYLATAGHFFVQSYIREQLQQWGSVSNHEFVWQHRGQTHTNLILKLPSSEPMSGQPVVIIGAHYDSVPGSPGADDNASGVAVLLEIARTCALAIRHRPLWFVAFDLEEYGLVGSTAYADLLAAEKQPIRLMISLEMLGYYSTEPDSQIYPPGLKYFYPNTGDFLALIGNLPTLPDLWRFSKYLKQQGVPCQGLPVDWRGKLVADVRRSDHAPFWDNGYRAMMVTDTANLRNPHYHRPSDRIETLNLEMMAKSCKGLAEMIQRI
jgi:Zn-dependent M28 family amino/carboxypeptidase